MRMSLEIELGRASVNRCDCCGKRSHTLRGFVSNDGRAYAAYLAAYTEGHETREGTLLVSIGDWGENGKPGDRTSVCMKVRRIGGRPQVMVVGPRGCPWRDVGVFGAILEREAALARSDIRDYFHTVDHLLEADDRFARHFR